MGAWERGYVCDDGMVFCVMLLRIAHGHENTILGRVAKNWRCMVLGSKHVFLLILCRRPKFRTSANAKVGDVHRGLAWPNTYEYCTQAPSLLEPTKI